MNETIFTEIKQSDLNSGHIRIKKDYKKHFPNEDCDIIVIVDNVKHSCKFRLRNHGAKPRSYTIALGKPLMSKLGMKLDTTIELRVIDNNEYKFI